MHSCAHCRTSPQNGRKCCCHIPKRCERCCCRCIGRRESMRTSPDVAVAGSCFCASVRAVWGGAARRPARRRHGRERRIATELGVPSLIAWQHRWPESSATTRRMDTALAVAGPRPPVTGPRRGGAVDQAAARLRPLCARRRQSTAEFGTTKSRMISPGGSLRVETGREAVAWQVDGLGARSRSTKRHWWSEVRNLLTLPSCVCVGV